MRRLLLAFFCACCCVFSSQAQGDSIAYPPIIFIYDASDSMWEKMAGKTKMQVAGKALSNIIDYLPPNQKIGLVVYGHKKKGCRNIKFPVALDNTDKNLFRESLATIKPTGVSPIAKAAEKVFDSLRISGQRATIILLTNSSESCNGDLCETIKNAKKNSIEFKFHIIDIGEKDTELFKCAAKAGYGQYYHASDRYSLEKGLKRAVSTTVDSTSILPLVKPENNFSAMVYKSGEVMDALIKAIPKEENKPVTQLRTYADSTFMSLTPGMYDFEFQIVGARNFLPINLSNVEIYADSLTHREVTFSFGKLSIATTKNNQLWDATINIFNNATNKILVSGWTSKSRKSTTVELGPGVYDIAMQAMKMHGSGINHRFEDITIKANETVELKHNFKSGLLTVFTTNNRDECDALVYMTSKETGKKWGIGRTYGTFNISEVTPETYDISIEPLDINGINKEYIIENVKVEIMDSVKISHNFETGILSVGAKSGDNLVDVNIQIEDPKTSTIVKEARTFRSPFTNPLKSVLLPGTYDVKVIGVKQYEGKMEKFTVEILPGNTIEKIIEF